MVKNAKLKNPHHKRHAKHQKQSRHFLKVYAPYLPLLITVTIGLVIGNFSIPNIGHKNNVLAYATSMSINDLLSSTNTQRISNGSGTLTLNSQLNQAAQSKANDMVNRNYWSHNTPEGNPPWIFFDQAGYLYSKAGENLAYGFDTSADTVAGWMNSPPHKDNLLDISFTDVGFGFAQSADFNNDGANTVVVAMYGQPKVEGATSPTPPPVALTQPTPPAPPATIAQKPSPPPILPPQPSQETPPEASQPQPTTETKPEPVNTLATIVQQPNTQKISKIQALTNGAAPWAASVASMFSVFGLAILASKHGIAMRHMIVRGERYIIHHALFDITVISMVVVSFMLTQTAGIIR